LVSAILWVGRSTAKLLTRDEARGIVANIAKLPELLGAYDLPPNFLMT
jgi:hypothetical protein